MDTTDREAGDTLGHDQLFKQLLTTFFLEFVVLLLPEVFAYLAPETVEFLDKEVFNDIASKEVHEVAHSDESEHRFASKVNADSHPK